MTPPTSVFSMERTDTHNVVTAGNVISVICPGSMQHEIDGIRWSQRRKNQRRIFSHGSWKGKKIFFFLFFPVCDGRWIGYANSPRLRDEVKSSIVFGVRGTLRSRSLFGGEREKMLLYVPPRFVSRSRLENFWPLVPKYRGFLTPDSR